jgi:ABC-type glycerol-3-phosphate transport system substrate-binding protein
MVAASAAAVADSIPNRRHHAAMASSARPMAAQRFVVVLLFWLAVLAIAGCSKAQQRGPSLDIALAVFPEEARRYQEFALDFERQSGIHLKLIAQSYVDILRALEAQAGAGRGTLDLAELDLSMLGEAGAYAIPVDDLVTPSARSLFPEAAWRAAISGGHVRFVPHRLMWQAMIYNHREVPHPPQTWGELSDFVRAHPDKLGLKAALYEGAVCDVMPFVWAAGGSETAPSSPGSLTALVFLAALAPDVNPMSQVFREMSILEAQARGQIWLHFNWPFAMSYLASKGLAPQVDLSAPIPAGPDGAYTVLGGGYLAIARSAPHPQAARAFLNYLLTAPVQERLSRKLGWYGSVPPAPGSTDAELYSGFTAMRDRVRARPTIAGYTAVSNRWQKIIQQVLFDNVQPAAAVAANW